MILELFNEKLNSRYLTLENNIKAKSNSFYDSYLDLLEETIKYILDKNQIPYDTSKTCGYLVRNYLIIAFFQNELRIDKKIYDKFADYIKKCNDHKHKKEKQLSIDSIINYLTIYFSLINSYLTYIQMPAVLFDKEYYISIFGETERLNQEYKSKLEKLMQEIHNLYIEKNLSEDDLAKYRKLLEQTRKKYLNLEEENFALQRQINELNEIKMHSIEARLDDFLKIAIHIKNILNKYPCLSNENLDILDNILEKKNSFTLEISQKIDNINIVTNQILSILIYIDNIISGKIEIEDIVNLSLEKVLDLLKNMDG